MAASPGLVKKRIQEMSMASSPRSGGRGGVTHLSIVSTARPFKRQDARNAKENDPTSGQGNIEPKKVTHNFSLKREGVRMTPAPFKGLKNNSSSPDPPPPDLPKRSLSQKSPEKPELPPKPKRLSGGRLDFPEGSSRTSTPIKKSENPEDSFCDSPTTLSFTKFNQRVEKLDLLKRRQSYNEFEELIEKKRELRERMMTKILLLREERDVLLEEKKANDNQGQSIMKTLEGLGTGQEVEKYRKFLDEIEQITKLTVSLTIRLSRLTKRIENSQLNCDALNAERLKERKLVNQTKEAETLHRNTDRRRFQVRRILAKYVGEDVLVDYDNFLENLIRLVTDLKETEQRIQLGEEQLIALNDNLNLNEQIKN